MGKCSRMKLWCSKYILYPRVTGRSVAKVLSLAVLPTSYLERKTSSRYNFSKIPPFSYSVAMVSLREPAKVRDTRSRFSALLAALAVIANIEIFTTKETLLQPRASPLAHVTTQNLWHKLLASVRRHFTWIWQRIQLQIAGTKRNIIVLWSFRLVNTVQNSIESYISTTNLFYKRFLTFVLTLPLPRYECEFSLMASIHFF